nr:hypothetical protein [uncultured Prevotella sp.]
MEEFFPQYRCGVVRMDGKRERHGENRVADVAKAGCHERGGRGMGGVEKNGIAL